MTPHPPHLSQTFLILNNLETKTLKVYNTSKANARVKLQFQMPFEQIAVAALLSVVLS